MSATVALLRLVAPLAVSITDVCGVGRGVKAKDLHVKSTSPGWGGGDFLADSDAKGVHVRRSPHGEGLVTWTEVHHLIESGLTPDLLAKAVTRYRLYVEVVMEPNTWWDWQHDTVHEARLVAHQHRYRRISDAMGAVVAEVITRGLAALAPEPTLLDLMEAAS